MRAVQSLCVSLLLQYSGYVSAAWSVGQEVSTTSGPVSGHAASTWKDVSEYLGIPFAAPPVDELRFMPPQSYSRTNKTIVAASYGPDCPGAGAARKKSNQTTSATSGGAVATTFSQAGHVYSEDCLSLNIWTKPQVGEKKKAVLVSVGS